MQNNIEKVGFLICTNVQTAKVGPLKGDMEIGDGSEVNYIILSSWVTDC